MEPLLMEPLRIAVLAIVGGFLLIFGGASWECAGEKPEGDRAWYRGFGLGCTIAGALSWVLI